MPKAKKWGTAEKQVLIKKSLELIKIISKEGKDSRTLELKQEAWEVIAASVNAVNKTGSDRSWKDCNNKWVQMKCHARGNIEELKKLAETEMERYLKNYKIIFKSL